MQVFRKLENTLLQDWLRPKMNYMRFGYIVFISFGIMASHLNDFPTDFS